MRGDAVGAGAMCSGLVTRPMRRQPASQSFSRAVMSAFVSISASEPDSPSARSLTMMMKSCSRATSCDYTGSTASLEADISPCSAFEAAFSRACRVVDAAQELSNVSMTAYAGWTARRYSGRRRGGGRRDRRRRGRVRDLRHGREWLWVGGRGRERSCSLSFEFTWPPQRLRALIRSSDSPRSGEEDVSQCQSTSPRPDRLAVKAGRLGRSTMGWRGSKDSLECGCRIPGDLSWTW